MSKRNKKRNNKKTVSTTPATKNIWRSKPCHEPTEVAPNLFLCKESQIMGLVKSKKIDVLVPLADLDGRIWKTGFNGEILYYPVEDYGSLPQHILKRCVTDIVSRLKTKKVAIFCMGGHGRTGYIAACVLGKMGYDDPIRTVRNKYCKSAIECNEQVESIAEFLGKPKLIEAYKMSVANFGWNSWERYYSDYSYNSYLSSQTTLLSDIYGVESEHIVVRSGFPEYLAKKWYKEDMETSNEEAEEWEEMDKEYRQKMYDFYYDIATGNCR